MLVPDAEGLTRNQLFNALNQRNTIATSGPRLDARVAATTSEEVFLPGDVVPANRYIQVRASFEGLLDTTDTGVDFTGIVIEFKEKAPRPTDRRSYIST